MIDVSCLCGKRFRAKPELAGRQVKCPECGQAFVVPSPKAEADDPFLVDLSGFEDQAAAAADDPLGLGAVAQTQQQPVMQQPLAGYDQMGGYQQAGYQTPAQPKRRKPGSGKTGFYVLVGVGSVVGVGAIIGVVLLVMNLFGSPHDRAADKIIQLTEKICEAFEECAEEGGNIDGAVAKVQRYSKELAEVMEKAGKLKDPPAAKQKRLTEKIENGLKPFQGRMMTARGKLRSKPEVVRRLQTAFAAGASRSPVLRGARQRRSRQKKGIGNF